MKASITHHHQTLKKSWKHQSPIIIKRSKNHESINHPSSSNAQQIMKASITHSNNNRSTVNSPWQPATQILHTYWSTIFHPSSVNQHFSLAKLTNFFAFNYIFLQHSAGAPFIRVNLSAYNLHWISCTLHATRHWWIGLRDILHHQHYHHDHYHHYNS